MPRKKEFKQSAVNYETGPADEFFGVPAPETEKTESQGEKRESEAEAIESRQLSQEGEKKKIKIPVRKQPTLPPQDELSIKIEKILEEGLNDPYQRLSPIAKQEFKLKGEQTARKIRDLMRGGRIKIKKILKLILEWLKMLPGVNRFFLEQEAKIKAEKIIALKNDNLWT